MTKHLRFARGFTLFELLVVIVIIVILAAINPQTARWDTPGVAAFRFRKPPLLAGLT